MKTKMNTKTDILCRGAGTHQNKLALVCDQTPTLTSDSVGKCRLAGVEKGVIALRLDGLLDGTSATI